MKTLIDILLLFIALEHIGFLILEMYFWDHRVGRKIFQMTEEFSKSSKALAANQGLYNGFLAAGLVWGFTSGQIHVQMFFLCCVLAAGVFGGLTAKRSILYTQALPAIITLALIYFSS
ncbi:MAG: DUF1304 domain-containing protein [Bacteroidetes bacterium]|nr:DUF1304 domain-containing protein [Bacteroidota bacterium]